MQNGFIKLYRELLEKPIWLNSSPEHKTILVTLLMMANHEPNEWEWKGKKFTVRKGQFISSLDSIRKKCGKGVSNQNIRSCLVRFEKLEFLTNESTKTGRLITIVNYGQYQDKPDAGNKETNKEVTKNQQRGNKEVTSNKNDKNDKNDKNIKDKVDFREFMTEEQLSNSEFLEKWEEWVNYRRIEKRNSLTNTSAKKQLKVLANAADPISCIDNSLLNGYTGIFDKKDNRKTDGKELAQVIDNF